MGYSGLIGETISVRGHNGDLLQSYLPTRSAMFCGYFKSSL